MTLTKTPVCDFGKKADEFKLKSINNKLVSLNDIKGDKATLVMFICNHCPFVKHINKGLVEFTNDLMSKNIGVIGVNSNDSSQEKYAEDSIEKMKEYAADLGYQFPYVVDEDQTVAKNFTAQCTPDFFFFNSDSELIYRGQFDFSRPGNDKPVTGESLAQAIDAYLDSNETISPQYPSMGCNIKWKLDEEPDYFLKIKG